MTIAAPLHILITHISISILFERERDIRSAQEESVSRWDNTSGRVILDAIRFMVSSSEGRQIIDFVCSGAEMAIIMFRNCAASSSHSRCISFERSYS